MPLALVAVAAATWFFARRSAPTPEPLQFAILASAEGEVSHMAISADGKMLAFVSPDEKTAEPMLHVQRVGSPATTVIAGSEGASYPFWSPDHEYLAFFANGKLQKVAASGGSPQTLASVSTARGGSWGSKNVIVYAPNAPGVLWKVNADGSGAAVLTAGLTREGEVSHRWPAFLPDGDHFLFWAGNFGNARDDRISGIYLSSLAAREKHLVVLAHSNVGYGDGHLVYADDRRQLVATPFNVPKAAVSGEPHAIAGSVGFQPATYWGAFAASENGTVVYNTKAQAASSALTWVDRSGKELGRVTRAGILANPTLSPAGDRVTVDIADEKTRSTDVWIQSLQGGANARFTFGPGEEVLGVWSRDGRTIAYRSNMVEGVGLFLKSATGLEKEKPLFMLVLKERLRDIRPNSWTPDSKQILCSMIGDEGGSQGHRSNLVLLPASGGDPIPFLTSKADLTNGQISPDGKWVAYASNESGAWEVYVTTFPNAAGKWQVSRGGGAEPRWRGDSKEIFYIGTTGTMMAVPVAGEDTFSTGTPVPLFQVYGRAQISSTDVFTYDVTKDGKRFLVNRYVKPERVTPLTIVLNATAGSTK